MIKIAICDDDIEYLDKTKLIINQWLHDYGILAELYCFHDGDSLFTKHKSCKFDIIFLDIIMPFFNGIDTARQLRDIDKSVFIVFLTSSVEFALESYSVKANDYILKPITYEKIKEVLDYYMTLSEQELDNIILKTDYGYQKIYLHDIEYIESQNKYCIFFLTSGKSFKTMKPLYSFEDELLNKPEFFKCHRSYIVSMLNIDHFNSTEITTKNGGRIPIARGKGKLFSDAYFAFMFYE